MGGNFKAALTAAIAHDDHSDSKRTLSCLDLFSGCGGFSLGMKRAGFSCVAAIDIDDHAIATFRENFKAEAAFQADLTTFLPEQLAAKIGKDRVDVIVGGPPCQGFSSVRKVGGSNHGDRLIEDPRRRLYRNYLHYVEFFRPSVFVMENVPGIRSAAGGEFFASIQEEARKLGYRVHGARLCAWRYGVPQKRERDFIIGTARGLPIFSTRLFLPSSHEDPAVAVGRKKPEMQRGGRGRRRKLEPPVTLWEAIGDLPPLKAGHGISQRDYDEQLGSRHLDSYGRRYLMDVLEADRADYLTGHVARPHSARDLRDFDRLREGENSKQAIERGEAMEFPYDRDQFKDRYTRQHRDGLCSTIVAHLGKDGLMFVHPTQCRSLTVREAARIQSFPDWFRFPQARTIAFRMVGNAVPPLLAECIGRGLKNFLLQSVSVSKSRNLPANPEQAVSWLQPVLPELLSAQTLRKLPKTTFDRAWNSVGFLDDLLHPDSTVMDDAAVAVMRHSSMLGALLPEIALPASPSTGWPLRLLPLAREAARRFQIGALTFAEYYYSAAQIAGWQWQQENSSGDAESA